MHSKKEIYNDMANMRNVVLLLLFSCLYLLFCVNAQDDCELTGFDLSELSKPAWWKLGLSNESGCIFAVTNGIFQHSDCDFYFSICHGLRELPECNTNGSWSVCQKGTFNDQPMSASIANYKPINESGTELTDSGQDGFRVFYTINAPFSDLCQNVTVNLTFLCDKDVTWPSTEEGGDAPNGLDTYSFIYSFTDKICKYSTTFKYKGACNSGPKPIGPTLCYINQYDFEFLSQKEYWEFDETDENVCHGQNSCHFFFRICEGLPQEIRSNCGTNSGVCINRGGTHYNLGDYNNTYNDLTSRSDGQGFVALYTGGDPAFLGCSVGSKMNTTLNFICGSSVWSNESSSALKPYSVIYDEGKCTAEFFFKYSGACIPAPFDVPVLFLFVLFVFIIFGLYWIIGSAINFAFGKRGTEIIPNKSFWLELLLLFSGGFIFLFKLITCRPKDSVEKTGDEEPIVKKGYQTIENEKYPFGP